MKFSYRTPVKMAGAPIYTPEHGPRHGVVVYNAGKLDTVNVRVRWSNGDVGVYHADDLEFMTLAEIRQHQPTPAVLFNRSGGDSYDAELGADVRGA